MGTVQAIFLTRFHPEKGPIVAHQIPEGSILPSPHATISRPLFDFASVSSYLIPPQEFCNRLVSITSNHHRIIGYPVCIVDPGRYERNEYIFNVAIVLEEGEDFTSFEGVVRKLARLFTELEGSGGLLSREEKEMEGMGEATNAGVKGKKAPHIGGKVYAICEMILEDLNNYCECMTPIDSANTLNMKLFPTHPAPLRLKPHHVPLATTRLTSLASPSTSTWDLTTTRLLPHINGINSIADIARLSSADLRLVRRSILHLAYYGFVLTLDIFSSGAVYAPTADICVIFVDEEMQEECARYCCSSTLRANDFDVHVALTKDAVVQLYANVRHGLTVRAWCGENEDVLIKHAVDIRRFMTFGVIKGFLYRVHRYAVATASRSDNRNSQYDTPPLDIVSLSTSPIPRLERVRSDETASSAATITPGQAHFSRVESQGTGGQLGLVRYMDGMHCFDEMCTELRLSEKFVEDELKDAGEWVSVWR